MFKLCEALRGPIDVQKLAEVAIWLFGGFERFWVKVLLPATRKLMLVLTSESFFWGCRLSAAFQHGACADKRVIGYN